MKTIAIITARGGSKRIPKKNIKEFLGRPIICYSIEAALESGCFDEVMVSTDSTDIADVAIAAGAKVPFLRNPETADDYAVTADVLYEVLKRYEESGQSYHRGCCLYPTAPFVTAGKLRTAMEMLENPEVETVVPVVPFSFPPQRGSIISDGYLKMRYPENLNTRSQDLEMMYHDCGQFYCFDVEAFLKEKKLFTTKTAPYIISELEVQDIDNISDWKLAEIKYQMMKEGVL